MQYIAYAESLTLKHTNTPPEQQSIAKHKKNTINRQIHGKVELSQKLGGLFYFPESEKPMPTPQTRFLLGFAPFINGWPP